MNPFSDRPLPTPQVKRNDYKREKAWTSVIILVVVFWIGFMVGWFAR